MIYTSAPIFGFVVKEVAGDGYDVRSFLTGGQSPHSFEPRPSDVRGASASRVLVYGAPNLDEWLVKHQDIPSLALIDLIADSLKLPAGSSDPNPHFWMDPIAVRSLARPLAESLCDLDEARCDLFKGNADRFMSQIDRLHNRLLTMVSDRNKPGIVVSHPFLDYFAHRYGIEVINISAGAGGLEPTPRDLSQVIRSVSGDRYAAVVTERGEPSPAARTVAEATGMRLITLDPLGGSPGFTAYADVILSCATAILPAQQ